MVTVSPLILMMMTTINVADDDVRDDHDHNDGDDHDKSHGQWSGTIAANAANLTFSEHSHLVL